MFLLQLDDYLTMSYYYIHTPSRISDLLNILKIGRIGTMPNHYLGRGYICRKGTKLHNFQMSNKPAYR